MRTSTLRRVNWVIVASSCCTHVHIENVILIKGDCKPACFAPFAQVPMSAFMSLQMEMYALARASNTPRAPASKYKSQIGEMREIMAANYTEILHLLHLPA